MAFPPRFLDEIRSRVRLSELVARHVKLAKRGREFVGLCPFHNERTPSFTVSDDKGFFHCFGCGAHGDVIGFVMQRSHLQFPDAVAQLAAEAGLEVPVATPEERQREERRGGLLRVMEAACGFYERMLRDPRGAAALDYLDRRGVARETAARFRLGFAPADGRLAGELAADADEDALVECGLVRRPDDGRDPFDFFRGRVMFPITDHRGRVVAFGGRTMGDGEPKYLNSPDTPLFDKRSLLYGLANARAAAHERGRVIAVEGYMDVIALSQAGFAESVAPLGTALTESHMHGLWNLADEPVLCFDGDGAGRRAALRAAERALPLLRPGKSLKFVTLPDGEDPDSLVHAHGPSALESLVERAEPLAQLLWSSRLNARAHDTPERLAGLERELEGLASTIADRTVQNLYRGYFRDQIWRLRGRRRSAGRETPRSSGLRPGDGAAALRRRRERALLATLLRHPWLVDEQAEALSMVRMSDEAGELAALFTRILEICAGDPDIDSRALIDQITAGGAGRALEEVLAADIRVHAGFAADGADHDEVREGLEGILAHYRRSACDDEAERAGEIFVDDPSEENWGRLVAMREAVELEMAGGSTRMGDAGPSEWITGKG